MPLVTYDKQLVFLDENAMKRFFPAPTGSEFMALQLRFSSTTCECNPSPHLAPHPPRSAAPT